MMIDENLTPKGETENPKPETSGAASDAATMVQPSPDEVTTPEPAEAVVSHEEPVSEAAVETPAPVVADAPTPEPVVSAPVAKETKPSAAAEKAAKASDDFDLFEAAMNALESDFNDGSDGGFKKLNKGDRVEATVIQVDKDRLFVNLGTKSEGIVPIAELGEGNIESAKDLYSVGDKIQVVVIRPEGAEGNAIVS